MDLDVLSCANKCEAGVLWVFRFHGDMQQGKDAGGMAAVAGLVGLKLQEEVGLRTFVKIILALLPE